MARVVDEDPLARVREVRGSAEQFQESDRCALEEIRVFLHAHEADAVRTATHSVLENYPDWWCRGRRAPPGLMLEDESELDELNKAVGRLHDMGIPMTLAERRTPMFRFFQEIDAWGTREASMPMEDLIGPECDLALVLGQVIGEIFPGHGGFLDAAVFDATGLSQTKGVRKTSLRLVWPSIVVDSDRAARVRDLVVHRLNAATAEGGPIAQLETDLRQYSTQNAWHSVFGDAAYGVRSNVRMPLCDRVSPLPLRAPEQRPLSPVGVLRFNYHADGKLRAAEWLCRQTELDGAEWVKIGSLRQTPNVQLTEWSVPAYSATQPIPPSTTRTGRVKVRTAGGSDAMVGSAAPRTAARAALKMSMAPERAGSLLTVERHFNGSPDQFAEKMEQHLGKAIVEPDGSYVWRQPSGEARIVMFAGDQRVKVIGRPNQVRSLIVIVSPYTEALQVMGCPLAGRQPQLPPGRAPSAAYAPSEKETPAVEASIKTEDVADNGEDTSDNAALNPPDRQRVAKQAFEPQGQGELELAEGETVVVPRARLLHYRVQKLLGGRKISTTDLRQGCLDAPGLTIEPPSARKMTFIVLLEKPPHGFKGFQSEEPDPIPAQMWEAVDRVLSSDDWPRAECMEHQAFVIAEHLQSRRELRGLSFGRALAVVRQALSTCKILGKRRDRIVPYAESEERERMFNASCRQPTGVEIGERYVSTVETFRTCLANLLLYDKEVGNVTAVSRLKNVFRERFHAELSETALGHMSMLELVHSEEVNQIFEVWNVGKNTPVIGIRSGKMSRAMSEAGSPDQSLEDDDVQFETLHSKSQVPRELKRKLPVAAASAPEDAPVSSRAPPSSGAPSPPPASRRTSKDDGKHQAAKRVAAKGGGGLGSWSDVSTPSPERKTEEAMRRASKAASTGNRESQQSRRRAMSRPGCREGGQNVADEAWGFQPSSAADRAQPKPSALQLAEILPQPSLAMPDPFQAGSGTAAFEERGTGPMRSTSGGTSNFGAVGGPQGIAGNVWRHLTPALNTSVATLGSSSTCWSSSAWNAPACAVSSSGQSFESVGEQSTGWPQQNHWAALALVFNEMAYNFASYASDTPWNATVQQSNAWPQDASCAESYAGATGWAAASSEEAMHVEPFAQGACPVYIEGCANQECPDDLTVNNGCVQQVWEQAAAVHESMQVHDGWQTSPDPYTPQRTPSPLRRLPPRDDTPCDASMHKAHPNDRRPASPLPCRKFKLFSEGLRRSPPNLRTEQRLLPRRSLRRSASDVHGNGRTSASTTGRSTSVELDTSAAELGCFPPLQRSMDTSSLTPLPSWCMVTRTFIETRDGRAATISPTPRSVSAPPKNNMGRSGFKAQCDVEADWPVETSEPSTGIAFTTGRSCLGGTSPRLRTPPPLPFQ